MITIPWRNYGEGEDPSSLLVNNPPAQEEPSRHQVIFLHLSSPMWKTLLSSAENISSH